MLASNLAVIGCVDSTDPAVVERSYTEPRILEPATTAKVAPSGSVTGDQARSPAAEPVGQNDAYRACWSGLVSSGNPELDVVRLGLLCGHSGGVEPSGPVISLQLDGTERHRSFEVARGGCAWVAGAVQGGTVELEWRQDDDVLAACDLDSLGWCPPSGPLCFDSGGAPFPVARVTLHVLGETPDGTFHARVWKRPR